jgi:hypothetical protein
LETVLSANVLSPAANAAPPVVGWQASERMGNAFVQLTPIIEFHIDPEHSPASAAAAG